MRRELETLWAYQRHHHHVHCQAASTLHRHQRAKTPDRMFGNACNINTIYNISDGDLNPSHHQADEYYRNTGDPRQETGRIQFARSMIILILHWPVAWVTIYAGLMR